jgi:hypothetical protein
MIPMEDKHRKRPARWIALFVVGFWLIMMAVLVWREVIIPAQRTGSITRRMDQPSDIWMGIYAGGDERIGFVNLRSMPEIRNEGTGVTLSLTMRMEIPVFGRMTDLTLTGNAWVSRTEGLRTFRFSFDSGDTSMEADGVVEDNLLTAQLKTGDELIPLSFPVKSDLLLSGGMGLPSLDVPLLEPGEEVYVDAFDPTSMSVGKVRIVCEGTKTLDIEGEAVETWVMRTEMSGFTSRAWVTQDEEVVRAETPFGFSLRKISPKEALQPVDPGVRANLIRQFAIRPDGKTPMRGATRMRVRIQGIEEDQLPPDEPLQRREGDTWLVRQPEAPAEDRSAASLPEAEKTAALTADPIIQSDHEKIVTAARRITGDADRPWEKALRIYDWVYENIEKVPVISVPSALEVLRTRRGDCNEHTILFTALARAADLPCRIAIGVTWSEEMQAFGYHAWPEIHAGAWIPMDPTLGQPLADAARLKLINGSIDQWGRLAAHIGRMRIEVLEVSRD